MDVIWADYWFGLVVLVVLRMSFRLRLACASSLGTICVGEAYIY